jgi:hypothetical protein
MRKSTVKIGLNLILAGLAVLILATFYHDEVAWLLFLSPGGETMFVYFGFFWGGMFGCLGILVAVAGLVRRALPGREVRLMPTIVLLVATILFYFFLLYSSFTHPEPPKMGPGETITI